MPKVTEIKPRRGTAAAWASANPVLASGEMGLETDTKKFKFGDGVTTWNSLAYAGSSGEPAITPGNPNEFWSGDKTWKPIENPVRTFAELQAAVATGGTIRIDNNYAITITSQLEITKPCHIIGGDLILSSAATWSVFNVTSSNVTFDTITFTAGGTTQPYRISARFISVIGSGGNKYKNIKVKGCTMQGNQGENIRMTWVTHSSVTDCTMDDFLYAGVLMLSCSDMKIIGNTITNGILLAPRVDVYGIAATDGSNTIAGRSKNITIIGNTVRNVGWEGIDTHGGEHIVIQGNIVTGCPRGIALVVGNPDRVVVPVDVVCTGNYVDSEGVKDINNVEREGISLFGLSGNLAYGTITDNIIRGYVTASNGLYLNQVDHKRTIISGNTYPHIPWTSITFTNTSFWVENSGNLAQFMVEGRELRFRGMATSASSSTANSKIGVFPAEFAPSRLTFMNPSQGSNAAATSGVIGIYPNGDIYMLYRKTPGDFYSYPIEGTVSRDIIP